MEELIVDILLLKDPLDGFRYRQYTEKIPGGESHLEMDNYSDADVLSNIINASKAYSTVFRFFCFSTECHFQHHGLVGHIARGKYKVQVFGENKQLKNLLDKFRIHYTSSVLSLN